MNTMTLNHSTILDQLSAIKTDKELFDFINKNPNLIVKYKEGIINVLKRLEYKLKSSMFVNKLYYDLSSGEFEAYGYDILREYFRWVPNQLVDAVVAANLLPFYRVTNISKLKEMDLIGYFLINIMDIYVPSNNPEFIISLVNYALNGDLNLISDARQCNYFREKMQTFKQVDSEDIDEAITLIKYALSTVEYEENNRELNIYLHRYLTTYANFVTTMSDITNKYARYFNLEPYELRPWINGIVVAYVSDRDKILNNINAILYELFAGYNNTEKYFLTGKNKTVAVNLLLEVLKGCPDKVRENDIPVILQIIESIKDCEIYEILPREYIYPELENNNDAEDDEALEADAKAKIPKQKKRKKSAAEKVASAENKIYAAFKKYKNAEEKVDSQLDKLTKDLKNLVLGDTRDEIIEGKRYTPIKLLKKILKTAAIFSFGPMQGIIILVVQHALSKKRIRSERQKILLELYAELEILNEKIDDARGDGNRQAKYAMMRTKTELENAIAKIKLGIEADEQSMKTADKILHSRK